MRRCLLKDPGEIRGSKGGEGGGSACRRWFVIWDGGCEADYLLGIAQSVHGWTFGILEEKTLLGLFLDELEMPGIALSPNGCGGGPVLNVAGEPWLGLVVVQVV